MKKLVAILAAALYLAACGAPASIAGSSVKSVTTLGGPNAAEVADGTKRAPAATGVSREVPAVSRPANPAPVTPALKPPAPAPAADGATPHSNCDGFSGPGKPRVMCVPQ